MQQRRDSVEDTEYDRIVNMYADVVYRVALSYCKNKYDAEDIVQNTFVKMLREDMEFQDDEHIRKWLIRVAVNECKSMWRSFWRKNVSSLDEIEKEPIFTTQEKSDLFYAVMKLPQKYRIVVHLYYYEEYTIKEIAGILGITETAIQTRLMRARNNLKQQLKEAWQ